jgi:hypothetical protein
MGILRLVEEWLVAEGGIGPVVLLKKGFSLCIKESTYRSDLGLK